MSDDVGDLVFQGGALRREEERRAGRSAHPGPERLSVVGGGVFRGLWVVPPGITSIRLTLDGGTVVTPEIIDISAVTDATLLFVAEDHVGPRVVTVEVTHA